MALSRLSPRTLIVAAMLASADTARSALPRLTARQREVLSLIAQGLSNAAVAQRLFISERTVVAHVSRIYDDLGLTDSIDHHRRVLAVLSYLAER